MKQNNLQEARTHWQEWLRLRREGKVQEADQADRKRAEAYAKLTEPQKDQFWSTIEKL